MKRERAARAAAAGSAAGSAIGRRKAEGAAAPRTIWYMGAKTRVLPGFLDEELDRRLGKGGSVLDVFSGTGTVAAHCARSWRTISNDVQRYAQVIARAWIERPAGGVKAFLEDLSIERDLLPAYEENRASLEKIYGRALAEEARLLEEYAAGPGAAAGRVTGGPAAAATGLADRYRRYLRRPGGIHGSSRDSSSRYGAVDPLYRGASRLLSERSLSRYRGDPGRRPACLMTAYYANVYYGLRQAIELDSLRAAIDALRGPEGTLDRKRAHYLSALLHAASVTTSGTAHFAQPRQLTKERELAAMARRRRLDVLATFREYSDEIARALAAIAPRAGNLALGDDYRNLLEGEGSSVRWCDRVRSDLVYVDPPYTQDNYSRFYHALEALARYDYPPLQVASTGRMTAGRYPVIGWRFQSGFCRPRAVEEEFSRVISASANSGSALVISYGSPNGLLLKVYRRRRPGRDPVESVAELCRDRYADVEVRRRRLLHSGMGDSNLATDELLFVCDKPR